MSQLLAVLWAVLLAAAGPSSPEQAAEDALVPDDLKPASDQEQATQAARLFVDTLQTAKAGLLAEMGTDPFSFDGRRVEGRKAIRDEWKAVFAKHGQGLKRAGRPKIEIMDYPKAEARFGKPPAKFDPLKPERCWFAAVSFPKRAGLVLIISKDKQAGWLVAGVTD